MSMTSLLAWINAAVTFGTIIMLGSVGEILTEKSGNLNLGVPGIMYIGGFAGFEYATDCFINMVSPERAAAGDPVVFCKFAIITPHVL